ncbi:MAG: ester cyclase [Solirubrobacterales bacterium]|nr:ester cyclase [Solirubrobacterales bacterium]MCB8969460.1 ester cyclase [Thermoleophilales bacterium]MCO5326513.1 ester cyclase [Solirubrobacterales bacterium]
MHDLEANKDVVRRFYAEVINGRDISAIDRLLTDDFTHDGELRGRDGQKPAVATFLDGFSDLRHEIDQILAEGDLVAARQTWSGTHDGDFAGVAATRRRVEFGSTAILRIRDGMIAAAWDQVDVAGLMAQLTSE